MNALELRRARVAGVGLVLVLRHGYARTTLDTVAAHSGEARSTICKQIGSKADVLVLVCVFQEQLCAAAIRRRRADARRRAARRKAGEPRWTRRAEQTLVTDPTGLAVIRAVDDTALRNRHLAGLERVVDEACRAEERGAAEIVRRWETARRRVAVRALVRGGRQPPRRMVDGLAPVLGTRPYLELVERCGWDDNSYEHWLAEAIRAHLSPRPKVGGSWS